ncbi:MAG: O-antigen ligase family protein [Xanthomonadaceae bacterium]|nr:O-antigen ligase family protein [Xanthomonadaceae bacterium]
MFLAMLAYLLLVLIRPQDYPELVDSFSLPLQPIALLLAAGFWMFSPRKNFDAPQYPVLLMFFVVLMVSHVFNGYFGGAVVQLNKFAPVLLAFVVFANGLDSRERILKIMAMFSLCAAIISIHGIEQVKLGTGWTGIGLSQGTRIQYVGIFNDPNDLGMLFVACVPMAAYLSSRGGLMGLRRLFWWIVTGILVYGIYLTDSRGSLLGLLLVLGLYVWQTRGMFIAGTLGAMAVGVLLALPSRFNEIDVEEASAQGRVDSWYEGVQMFIGHPIFGVGPDMYSDYHHLTAHNSFVLVMAETGIIGYTLWLAFILYGFRMMWAASRGMGQPVLRDEDAFEAELEAAAESGGDVDALVASEDARDASIAEGRGIAMALLLSLAGFFTCAFFLSRSYVVILYLLAAVVVAHYVDMRRDDPSLPHFTLSKDLLLLPIVGVIATIGLMVVVKVLLVIQ